MSFTLAVLWALGSQNQTCPGQMEYSACGSACNKTCLEPAPVCAAVCVPRCECPEATPLWFPETEACATAASCTLTTPPTTEAMVQLPNRPPPPGTPPSPPRSPPSPLPPPHSPPSSSGSLVAVAIAATAAAALTMACACVCCRTSRTAPDPARGAGAPSIGLGAYRPLLTSGPTAAPMPVTKPPWTFKSISFRSIR